VVRTVASELYTLSLQGPWYGNFSRELFCQYSYSRERLPRETVRREPIVVIYHLPLQI
jgi:hypothetical protein